MEVEPPLAWAPYRSKQNSTSESQGVRRITIKQYGSLFRAIANPDGTLLCPLCKSASFYDVRDLISHIIREH
ncbi:MAG: hypothetical protein F7B95_00450 [Desulfurococcales archaeon]|nr:hypothetical protein [Desulfurococcales archaeon]